MGSSGYAFLEGADDPDEERHLLPVGGRIPRYYGCKDCHERVQFGKVLYMSRIVEDSFTLGYLCNCKRNAQLIENKFKVDRQSMRNLLGPLRPHLPYRA